jgi:hypothetical protein
MLAGTGHRERCMRCGERVIAVLRKLCSRCGRDVSNAPRLKDASGEYFCQPCWIEVCEARGTEPAYQCGECNALFAGDEVYQEKTQYICKACFAARADPGGKAADVLSGLAEAEESPETVPSYVPSYYASTVAARNARQAVRSRIILGATLIGASLLIVAMTMLLMWYRQ